MKMKGVFTLELRGPSKVNIMTVYYRNLPFSNYVPLAKDETNKSLLQTNKLIEIS